MEDIMEKEFFREALSTLGYDLPGAPVIAGVSGGSINECAQIRFGQEKFFVKWNSKKRFPGMFEAEREGLELLRASKSVKVPSVIGIYERGDISALFLKYIERGRSLQNGSQSLGHKLGLLHKVKAENFGNCRDNYIGSLPQSNKSHSSWSGFFTGERLKPLVTRAFSEKLLDLELVKKFDRFYDMLDGVFPDEQPSLLHGDLWSGNYMIDHNDDPVIFDPAVYYGSREMDIAMTRLFGGFSEEFYHAYNSEYPLAPGWEERMDLCNLYPLLVHLNLFGRGYLPQIQEILNRFA